MSDAEIMKQIRADERCESLTQYLEKFDLSIQSLSEPELAQEGAQAFVESLAEDNIKYAEVRFSPKLLCTDKFSEREALVSVLKGLEGGAKRYGIFCHTIICAMRHFDEETNLNTFRLAEEFLGRGVCGVDLAGDESKYPTEKFSGLFSYASDMELAFTIHAGECGSPESVRQAVGMGARRIGHGIAMKESPSLQKICKEFGIGIEMCPVSNFQTRAVKSVDSYPIREFLDQGVCVTVNTDNRTVSNTSITRELTFLNETFGIKYHDMIRLEKNAVKCCFADKNEKNILWKMIDKQEDKYQTAKICSRFGNI